MKIYKNPFVSQESYFIPIGPARTAKGEAKATRGYIIEEFAGSWSIRSGAYYDHILQEKLEVVGEIKKQVLEDAVINCVLKEIEGNENRTPIMLLTTNGDRIRAMSDEELAYEFIYFRPSDSCFEGYENKRYLALDGEYYESGKEAVEANLKWLKT